MATGTVQDGEDGVAALRNQRYASLVEDPSGDGFKISRRNFG